MSRIVGNQNELFYNLTHRELVHVGNSLIGHMRRRTDINGIRISHVLIKCAFSIVYNLAMRGRACMYNFTFLRNTDGKKRVTRAFVNLMMGVNHSLIYAEEGGWKDMTVDINNICIQSQDTLKSKNMIALGIDSERELAIGDIDYTGVINMTNNSSFRQPGQIDDILVRVYDFTEELEEVSKLNIIYNHSLSVVEHYTSIHRLNIRTRTFKPWKLYSCKPIYPDCMSRFSYYDEPLRNQFDANFVMPEDIGRIITEFVGHEFISNVRFGLVIAAKGRDNIRKDIESALGKWRKNELLNFVHTVSYNYIKITNYSNIILFKQNYRKETIINLIMTNFDNKELYYPFYRDVMILTPIIIKQRAIILNKNKLLRNR